MGRIGRCLLAVLLLHLSSGSARAELVEGTVTAVPRPTLHVTGRGTLRVAPDTVRITARIVTEGPSVADARERNARIVQAALGSVASLGLPNAASRTVDYTLERVTRDARVEIKTDPEKWDLPWRSTVGEGSASSFDLTVPVTLGYRASNSLTVRVQGVPAEELSSAAGRIVDALMEAGCDEISRVSYTLEMADAYDQAVRGALVLAVKDAAATAEAMASASGRHIAGIRHMEPSRSLPSELLSNQYPVSSPRPGSGDPTTAIQVGMLEVSAQVSVQYEIEYNPGDTRFLPASRQ